LSEGGKSRRAMRKFRTRMTRNQVSVRRGGIGIRGVGVCPGGAPGPRGAFVAFRLAGCGLVRSGEVMGSRCEEDFSRSLSILHPGKATVA
jgi:hypothetical protein